MELTPFEKDLQRRYVSLKVSKFIKLQKLKKQIYNVVATVSDLKFLSGFANYRTNESGYQCEP